MKSDEIARRDIVKTIVMSPVTLLPLQPLVESSANAKPAGSYSPKFFSPSEMELVATIGELILPQTDTPGARAVGAQEHIDRVLSEASEDEQHEFRDGLAWLERRSQELFGRSFKALNLEKQIALLTKISDRKTVRPEDERGYQFFLDIRSRVVFSYYTSEVGLMQELTYKGKQVLGHWEGCPHADRHGDSE
jgi:hypothetical protein